jgi:hypothetical protein
MIVSCEHIRSGSLEGGREEFWEVWFSCSCNVRTCSCKAWTMDAKVSRHASSARIWVCASGEVRSHTSCGNAGGVSMATGYATSNRHHKNLVFTS